MWHKGGDFSGAPIIIAVVSENLFERRAAELLAIYVIQRWRDVRQSRRIRPTKVAVGEIITLQDGLTVLNGLN
jgi:hypothetical protein